MKSFIAALVLVCLLVGCIVTVSLLGEKRLDEYMELMPEKESTPEEGVRSLYRLRQKVDQTLWFLNSFSHHDASDHLYQTLSAATAAAESGDETEYRIHTAELRAVLEDLHRELAFDVKDFF